MAHGNHVRRPLCEKVNELWQPAYRWVIASPVPWRTRSWLQRPVRMSTPEDTETNGMNWWQISELAICEWRSNKRLMEMVWHYQMSWDRRAKWVRTPALTYEVRHNTKPRSGAKLYHQAPAYTWWEGHLRPTNLRWINSVKVSSLWARGPIALILMIRDMMIHPNVQGDNQDHNCCWLENASEINWGCSTNSSEVTMLLQRCCKDILRWLSKSAAIENFIPITDTALLEQDETEKITSKFASTTRVMSSNAWISIPTFI